MARIPLIEYDEAEDRIKKEFDYQISENGRITNMKKTLLHSLPAYKALMEWYNLRDEIKSFIGDRGVVIFSHSISVENDCLICSTFFRKIIIENGEKPETLQLDDREKILAEYGRLIAESSNSISDEFYAKLKERFSDSQIVLLTAFAGIMTATNIFNNALKVDLDEYLYDFRKK